MDSLLGLGSSKSSSRSASPGKNMNPGSTSKSTPHGRNYDLAGTPSSRVVPRRSPEITHEEATPTRHFDDHDDPQDPLHSSARLSNGSSEQVPDDVDGSHSSTELARQRAAIEHLQNKISRTKQLIREEQTTRDDNVNEYLKLASSADKQQIQRIKSVFEKKNQKSAQIISQLQKKLESYCKRIRELESQRPPSGRQPREVLRDMGQGLKHVGGNIRDGISGFSGGVVENIKGGLHGAAENGEGGEEDKVHHGSATLPGNCGLSSTHGSSTAAAPAQSKFPSDEGSPCSSVTSESLPLGQQTSPRLTATPYNLGPIFTELQERREEIEMLKEKIEALKGVQNDYQYLLTVLQDERFRSERLEEQVNDLTELHQNEVENLKQTLTDMEEKVHYQSEERLRDIHEMLESCQTKISKMEHQQAQHQQYVTLEGIDNSNARALVVKLINILLTVLQVVLLLVATGAGIIMPFLKTRFRILSTLVLIAALVFALKQWPELRDLGVHLIRHIKEALTVK